MHKKILQLAIIFIVVTSLVMLAGCDDSTNYERHPDSDERIDVQLENQIRRDFVSRNQVEFSDVYIPLYFGTYNGVSAIRISFVGENFPFSLFLRRTIIGGIDFGYTGIPFMVVWSAGSFYQLSAAYELGLLNVENIERIRYYWEPFYRDSE